MRVLQLCFVSNMWSSEHDVTNIDIKSGSNVLDLPDGYGKSFDIIMAAPPCDQFTKANSLNWLQSPDYFIKVAQKAFNICVASGKPWIFENPPGRIESFIPGLRNYRICTWHGTVTNKEYVVYSNIMLMFPQVKRYGKYGSILNYSKAKRELWQVDFFADLLKAAMLA